jgi:hypothetical protein
MVAPEPHSPAVLRLEFIDGLLDELCRSHPSFIPSRPRRRVIGHTSRRLAV